MKKYILYFVSGLTFIFLVVASLLIYEGVYLQYKPLSNLININEIEKVDLKYYDDSLNESIISLNNEKKELFVASLKKIEYQNTFSLNNLSSKETNIVTYKDDSTISLMQYFVPFLFLSKLVCIE